MTMPDSESKADFTENSWSFSSTICAFNTLIPKFVVSATLACND